MNADSRIVLELSRQLNISPVIATLLYQRGIVTVEQANKFFSGGLKDLSDPFILTGMAKAVERIKLAVKNHEKIIIYGDYDVDGICSIVIMKDCLAAMNCEVDYYVPDRFSEGYGINKQAISDLAAQGYSLLISVDCGITSIDEVCTASLLGIDCIITDHHTPATELPPAAAVINPRLDQPGALSGLAGAGVAFMLARAIGRESISDEKVYDWLDLVALATIADIVPLQDENRILVKEGLLKLQNTRRAGLQALMQETGLSGKPLSAWQVSFVLAPRLNSAGRLQSAAISIELLLSTDHIQCMKLAQNLCRLNDERKAIENNILNLAVQQIETQVNLECEKFLVLAGEGWHQGVLGIVASRLCDKYTRPVVLISWDGDTGRGSGRSVGNLDLYQALDYSREHLVQFGGHKMAAGLTIHRDQFESFKRSAREWTVQNVPELFQKEVRTDMEIDIKDINEELCYQFELMQPFGAGNPEPALVIRGCKVTNPVKVGKNGEHIKYRIGERELDCIAFNRSGWLDLPLRQCCQDIVFEPVFNEFRGKKSVQLKIKDMKCSYVPDTGFAGNTQVIADYNRLAERAASELKAGRPVLFIYPTCRSMAKHKLAINNCFNPGIIKPLHGQMGAADRKEVREALEAGQPDLFLITDTYLKHYCRESAMPGNLACIAFIWPEEQTVPDNSWYEKYDITVLPTIKQTGPITRNKHWRAGDKRLLVYTNRKRTLQRLNSSYPSFIEAGLTDLQDRRLVRHNFADCQSGALWWDGSSSCLPPAGEINELVLADVPYGLYELFGAYGEIAASADLPTIIAFEPEDLAFNRSYLNRLCPQPDEIMAVWKYLNSHPGDSLHLDRDILLKELENFMHMGITWTDLAPVIHILTDLDLCRMQKQGSIIEIKFIKREILASDINNSLYYLEGLAEKAVYSRFEAELTKNWSGDGNGTRGYN